uniref:Nucleotid_trans domain-containing protein n=1 Tax=Parastrongyloides trichosuri TaxID=131310 RepID=A0A0N4ZZE1_PARTI
MARHVTNKKVKLFSLLIIFAILYIIYYTYFNDIYYNKLTYNDIVSKEFKKPSTNIYIITIVDSDNFSNYDIAMKTMKCYALFYGYNYIILNINKYQNFTSNCKQKDFMYKRHCFLANYLKNNNKDGNLILFIDADIGVINPIYKLEDYAPRREEEIVFYERIFNHEAMAGSFFIKNSRYSRKFLMNWADYDFKHPNSFDGRDNVGLHFLLLDYIPKKLTKHRGICYKTWNISKSWEHCSIFVACCRHIMNKACKVKYSLQNETEEYYTLDLGRIKILKKHTKRVWVRDIWLTDSLISMVFNFDVCHTDDFRNNWVYNKKQVKSNVEVSRMINNRINAVSVLYDLHVLQSGILEVE